jgi:hypothetical protein
MTMASWLLGNDDGNYQQVLKSVKQAIAAEYVPVSEYNEASQLYVLIQHPDHFDWIPIQEAIPVGSARTYPQKEAVDGLPKLATIKR